jgi:23S rRNA pseudouridine2605 synthase
VAGVRLQRLMADAGVASRRACEELIESGHVTVNGLTVTKLPVFVDPAADDVEVDGRRLPREAARRLYIMLHKPPRTLTSTADEDATDRGGRTTVLDLVDHPAKARLFPVGRLDYQTTGLVLLTNDGDLANRLTHARHGVPKTYEALVRRALTASDLLELERALAAATARPGPPRKLSAARRAEALAAGEDQHRPVRLELVALKDGEHSDNTRILITLTEGAGPGRQVRDVLARLGCPVKRLRRIAIGPLLLKGVAMGQWRELERGEVVALKRAAGLGPAVRRGTPRTRAPVQEGDS